MAPANPTRLIAVAVATLALAAGCAMPAAAHSAATGHEIVYRDDFSRATSGWPSGSGAAGLAYGYTAQGYRIQLAAAGAAVHVEAPFRRALAPLVVEADVRQVEGNPAVNAAVICDSAAGGFKDAYFFTFGFDGGYAIGRRDSSGYRLLTPPAAAGTVPRISGTGTNQLRARCDVDRGAPSLTMWINGVEVAAVRDANAGRGWSAGFLSGIRISVPPGAGAEPAAVLFTRFAAFGPG